MANSKGERSETEARMNEPESESKKIEWKEPEGKNIWVRSRGDVRKLLEDLRDALRVGEDIWFTEEDFNAINRMLTRVLETYGVKGFFAYVWEDGRLDPEEGKKYVVIVPAVELYELPLDLSLPITSGRYIYLPSYRELRKRKVLVIVDSCGWRKVAEDDKDFEAIESYIKGTGASFIEPIFCPYIDEK